MVLVKFIVSCLCQFPLDKEKNNFSCQISILLEASFQDKDFSGTEFRILKN